MDESDLPPFDRDASTFRYDRWHGWWHLARTGRTPAFPFGFGRSYAALALSEAAAELSGAHIHISGSVSNTSERAGSDAVQVYVDLPDPEAPPRLVGFVRLDAPARRQTPFTIDVPIERLALRAGDTRSWRPVSGRHRLTIARYAGDRNAIVIDLEIG